MYAISTAWARQVSSSFSSSLHRHPCFVHALHTALIMGAGDAVSQVAIERTTLRRYDALRTLRFFGVGLLLAGPGMHFWYSRLDRLIRGRRTLQLAVKKTALDQCFFLPLYLGCFISVMSLLRRERPDEIRSKLARDFRPLLLTSYGLWPGIQILNFYAVPLHYRIFVINGVGLVWNTYIAWRSEMTAE